MSQASRLFESIAFDAVTSSPDGYGGTIEGFAEQFIVRAARKFLRGGEGVQAARLEGKQPVVLTIRASSQSRTITTDWRARDTRSATVYNIRSVEPSENRAFLDLLCESGVAV
jgi:SPP1 family predicted phage head-tail adaptor